MSFQVSCCPIVKKSHHTTSQHTDRVPGMFLLAYISITYTHGGPECLHSLRSLQLLLLLVALKYKKREDVIRTCTTSIRQEYNAGGGR